MPRIGLHTSERLIEVGNEVIGILETDRVPDKPVGNTGRCSLLRCQRAVSRRRRMDDDSLIAPQVCGVNRDFQILDHAPDSIHATLHHECQERRDAVTKVPHCHVILRMTGQTWVVDALYLGVFIQEFGHALRIADEPWHANVQGFQSDDR